MATLEFVALFPGQGSQHVGMGKDLCENFRVARETFEEASEAIKKDLKKLCFEGPDTELTLTENTQPALLTTSVAAFRVASEELGFKPIAAAGHSLGEYSALVALGALPLATAATWVKERGKSMQQAVPAGQGTMAAIMGLEDNLITALCEKATAAAFQKRQKGESASLTVEPVVEPANFNAPGQIVIAGSTDAVAEAVSLVKAGGDFAGGKAIPLQVSAPFHCSLMTPARDRMAEIFKNAKGHEQPKALLAPYIPNRTARLTSESGVIFELLIDQVNHPVLWKQSMTHFFMHGDTHFVEFGPCAVLAGLAKRIAKPINITPTLANVANAENLRALEALLQKKEGGIA